MERFTLLQARSVVRLAAAASVVLLSSGVAFAQVDTSSTNQNTGPNSINRNNHTLLERIDYTLRRTARSTNNINASLDTGHNTTMHNTTVDGTNGGDISGGITLGTELNHTADPVMIEMGSSSSTSDNSNSRTGPSSDNRNTTTETQRVTVNARQDATATTNANVNLNTGHDTIRDNTTVRGASTGDINLEVIDTKVLNSSPSVQVTAGETSDTSGDNSNSTTGPNSLNRNDTTVTRTLNVNTTDNATATSNYNIVGDSGHNTIRNNTTVTNPGSGDIDFVLDSYVSGN